MWHKRGAIEPLGAYSNFKKVIELSGAFSTDSRVVVDWFRSLSNLATAANQCPFSSAALRTCIFLHELSQPRWASNANHCQACQFSKSLQLPLGTIASEYRHGEVFNKHNTVPDCERISTTCLAVLT